MSTTDKTGANLAARLFEQLLPFQTLDTLGHLWAMCDGIYAMFQQVETLTETRDDDLSGWANLLDIDKIDDDKLGYLAQFVGVTLKPGLSDADQRTWIKSLTGFARGRPATIITQVQATLTGTKFVDLRERVPNAWRYTVVTRPSETPNPTYTEQMIQEQKPGPDQATHLMFESATFEWVKDTYATFAAVRDGFATYQALTNATI